MLLIDTNQPTISEHVAKDVVLEGKFRINEILEAPAAVSRASLFLFSCALEVVECFQSFEPQIPVVLAFASIQSQHVCVSF